MPQLFLLGVAGLLGLAVGSFLNVVIYRVPRDESLVRPGSHCPHCGNEVRNRHNIPMFGWLLLRGKCADCKAPISPRYPLVEAGTAALFVAVAARFGWSWATPRTWPNCSGSPSRSQQMPCIPARTAWMIGIQPHQ